MRGRVVDWVGSVGRGVGAFLVLMLRETGGHGGEVGGKVREGKEGRGWLEGGGRRRLTSVVLWAG